MSEAWFEKAFGAHYPRLYAHRDEEEARRCLDLLPRLAPLTASGLPVLDLGCGEGRHLQPLRDRGLPAVGLDLSADLLTRARRQHRDLPLVRGDMRALPFSTEGFGAILNLFTAFGYFGPLAANAPVVAEIARCLCRGGHWFLDYLDADRVREELSGQPVRPRERRLGSVKVVETRRLTPRRDQVCKDVVMTLEPGAPPLEYTEEVALFTLEEIDEVAAAHGLQRVAGAGDYDGGPLGQGDRWLLVYRKGGT